MVTTRIKGNQIFDGTIKSEDIDDSLEKEFTKVRVTTDDSTPDFLYSKITTSGSITVNVIGVSGSSQLLAISGTTPGGSTTQIQFNDGGNFGADDGLTFNKSSNTLFVSGALFINSTSPTYGESFKLNHLVTSSADIVRVGNYSQFTLTGSSASPSGDASILIGALQETYNLSKLDSIIGGIRGLLSYAIHQSPYSFNTSWGLLGVTSVRKPEDSNTAGNVGSAVGVYSSIGFTSTSNFSGSISDAYGFRYNNSGINNVRTVTNSYGIQLLNVGAAAGVTNAIGIDIQQINTASGIKLGIRVQDPIVIGTTDVTGSEKLRIVGDTRSEGTFTSVGNILPSDDVTYSLGSSSQRWQHIYTGDLHLKNERGDWTIIEEEIYLTIRNNKNGKRYKINMEPLPELDEEIGKFSTGPKLQ